MRALIAHSFYRLPGGEDRYVRQQVELLGERHTVELLERSNADLSGGVSVAAHMIYSAGERQAVRATIDRFEPDLIHLHNAYPSLGPAVHLAAQELGVPLIMTVHNFRLRCPNGYMFTEGSPCRRCEGGRYHNAVVHRCLSSRSQSAGYAASLWVHRFLLHLDSKVALYLTPSDFLRRRMVEWGFSPKRVTVLRNFTEITGGEAEPGSHGLYLGRLSPEKGVDVLLRSLARAGDPPFVIAGEGPHRSALERLATDLGLVGTRFVGQVPIGEVTALLASSRFLAVPSLWDENAPLAALEAMASGRPLLVTDAGGLPELVASGEGLSCPPGDEEALAGSVSRLMADDELCRALGKRGLARAAEFVPARHLAGLESIYAGVIA